MITLPAPGDAARLASVLRQYPRWSFFWDKKNGLWRAAEDDPDSALYAESPNLDTVIGYISTPFLTLHRVARLPAPLLPGRPPATPPKSCPVPGCPP